MFITQLCPQTCPVLELVALIDLNWKKNCKKFSVSKRYAKKIISLLSKSFFLISRKLYFNYQ